MTAKHPSSSTRLPGSLLPIVIVAAGIALTLWMLTLSHNGVFFSEEGGLKALVAQQVAQQLQTASFPLDVSLNLPAADWVKNIWQAGLYPFSAPAVYEVGTQHFIAAPFIFPLISAPFYALFGDHGLYIIPLAALWLTWVRFWQVGLRAGWGVTSLCLGLIALIFASPLSLYGGLYWEHTLAVALAFWGVSGLMFPNHKVLLKGRVSLSRPQALRSGILIGLAVWFRPEFLGLVAAVSVLALIGWALPKWRLAPAFTLTKAALLIGGMGCTVGLLLALNYGVYGSPMGLQQMVGASSISEQLSQQLSQSKASYWQLWKALQQYFPVIWVVGLAAIFGPELQKSTVKASLLKRNTLKDDKGTYFEKLGIRKTLVSNLVPSRFAIALTLLFALAVPLILPEDTAPQQWGPRFYLLLMPLLSLVLGEQLRANFFRSWSRRLLILGTAIALVLGIHLNTIHGIFHREAGGHSTSLVAPAESTTPTIEALQQDPAPWIATSHGLVAQQLWSTLPGKTFFKGETVEQVKQLATALAEQNESEFLYVCAPNQACTVPETEATEFMLTGGTQLNIAPLDNDGTYPVYKVKIGS